MKRFLFGWTMTDRKLTTKGKLVLVCGFVATLILFAGQSGIRSNIEGLVTDWLFLSRLYDMPHPWTKPDERVH